MYNTKYNIRASLDKALSYTASISKEPVIIEIEGLRPVIFSSPPKIEDIIISKNYYRDYSCMDYNGCNICCTKVGFWNIFSAPQYNDLKSRNVELPGMFKNIKVNDKEVSVYIEDHTETQCFHLVKDGCSVHTNNPIHCMFPLIKFKRIKQKNLYITKEVFGRNWAMGCPINLPQFKTITEETYQSRCIKPLIMLKEFSEAMGVETHIDYIISKVEENRPSSISSLF